MFRLYRYANLQRNGVRDASHCKPETNRLKRTGNASFTSNSATSMYGWLHSPHNFDVCERRACKPFGFLCASIPTWDYQLCVRKLRKTTISFLMSVRLHGTNRLPMAGFSWSLMSVDFSKSCLEDSNFIKIWQEPRVLYMEIFIHYDHISLNSCQNKKWFRQKKSKHTFYSIYSIITPTTAHI